VNVNGTVRLALAFAILVLLNYTLRPLLGWRTPMDFLIIALLLAAVRVRPGAAAVIGCVMGLAADSMAPASFGWGALAMTAVGYAASWLKAVFFADNLLLNGLFFFLGKWVYDLLFLIAQRQVHGAELVMQALVWSPLAAAATALSGIVLLVLLRPLLETSPAA
jgi:rod shape-determining protein MreD